MSLTAKLRRAPLRLATGAYILNTGIGKLSADEETAKQLHGMASGTYRFLGKMDPKTFAKVLAVGEITVGGALLLPIVPPVIAGGALLGFSGALLNVYWNTPGMHEDGDPRPTNQGVAMAKDVWMFGIGVRAGRRRAAGAGTRQEGRDRRHGCREARRSGPAGAKGAQEGVQGEPRDRRHGRRLGEGPASRRQQGCAEGCGEGREACAQGLEAGRCPARRRPFGIRPGGRGQGEEGPRHGEGSRPGVRPGRGREDRRGCQTGP